MSSEPTTIPAENPTLQRAQVYGMAFICLALGLIAGYVFRGSDLQTSPTQSATMAASPTAVGAMGGQTLSDPRSMSAMPAGNEAQPGAGAALQSPHGSGMSDHAPSLQDMKQMADSKAAPLLAKLKNDPNNANLLDQVGAVYHATHQFKQAATYYDKAVRVDPKNVSMRTKLAISLYRSGDVDGAIGQLDHGLSFDPKDANSLFDLGMIRLQGKQDPKGALAAWQLLLKSNPQLSMDRRATVEKLIASVKATVGDEHAVEGARNK
jgi:tetratricopeptide (TPR) repeat protein